MGAPPEGEARAASVGSESSATASLERDILPVSMLAIVKQYGSTTALAGVDFALRPGAIHALLGENGAGKSTLMHVLAGQTRPSAGTIYIDQAPVVIRSPAHARRLGIAMVHQHFALAPALTVAENLALDAAPVGASPFDRLVSGLRFSAKDLAAPALNQAERLGWKLNPGALVSSLSVGQQQRVEIVKALATEAHVLIFDEPTAVLNAGEIAELFGVLRLLKSENKAIVLIAHKLAEILEVGDEVTVLRRGKKVATAAVKDTDAAELAAWMIGASLEANARMVTGAPELRSLSAGGEPICSANRICINGDRGEQLIRDLDLQVQAGEVYGIGGVDGNGQVELAETLVGLRSPDSGELTITAAETGYIPQDRRRAGLAITMSVADNLLFEAAQRPEFLYGPLLRMGELQKLCKQMVSDYDIRTPGLDLPVSALSGGNQQKIVVARTLRSEPGWIVAMNPTRGLDIGATRFVHDQLRKARNRGAGVLVISTDLDELAALADRTAILAGGGLTPYHAGSTDAADIGLLLGGVPKPPSTKPTPPV